MTSEDGQPSIDSAPDPWTPHDRGLVEELGGTIINGIAIFPPNHFEEEGRMEAMYPDHIVKEVEKHMSELLEGGDENKEVSKRIEG